MANTSSPHEAYSSTLPADLTSSYLPDTSFITNSPQARNSFSPPAALGGGAYTGFSEAINSIPATWGMSDEGYILSRLNDEPTQHREYNLRPADPGVERMLEDFEKSEIEDWEFNMVHFHHVYGSQWREPYDEADQYDGFSNGTIMPLTVEEFRERLFDEALLEDFERYEKAEEEFWMMRGVAHMYGMWDEEYWQTQLHSPWRESTYHLGREEVEANSPLRAERWRDTWKPVEEDRVIKHQTHEVPWREQMRKHGENGTPSVISWPELPRCPSQCTEYRKLIHGEMSPGMSKATQCPEPGDHDLTSLGSECGQNSIYHELPEEDLDWVKLDEEPIALPPPPSPIVETYFIEIPKIPEPESEQGEAWTLIVSS